MKPCAHSFVSGDKRKNSAFGWKNEDLPSCEDNVTHIALLEKYNIPYIFDIHCHFFPEAVMRAIWKWFDKVDWFITYRMSAEKRMDALKRNRVEKFTTLNYAHKPGMAEGLNEWVFQNCSDISGAVLFGTFYPEKSAFEYVKKAVEEYGFRGFKLHCEVSKLDLMRPELKTSFEYLEKNRIPVVIHTGTAPLPGEFTGIKYFRPFMEKYPELNVIAAHMGSHEILEYAELFPMYPGFRMDTTMVFVDFFATGESSDRYIPLLEKYADRIHFGSDFPNIPYNYSHPVESLLNELTLSASAKRKIFYENSENLFSQSDCIQSLI